MLKNTSVITAVLRIKTPEYFSQNAWYLGKIAQAASGLSLKKLVDFQIDFVLQEL